jgi:hypothetical protein
LYGSFQTSVDQLKRNMGERKYELRDVRGFQWIIEFPKFEIVEQQSFIEYLKDGWKMNMVVAIDFTASNGQLHFLDDDPATHNDYETTIL